MSVLNPSQFTQEPCKVARLGETCQLRPWAETNIDDALHTIVEEALEKGFSTRFSEPDREHSIQVGSPVDQPMA